MICGNLSKLISVSQEPIAYALPVGDHVVPLNPVLGRQVTIEFNGAIHCIACGRKTNKSFSQGYCFPCTQKLAACDLCIVRPETCHYDQGTCREPEWAQGHCMQPHIVYLANSSGLKVGITRATQVPTRWIDQGATQALPIFGVQTRRQAGLIEAALKAHVADRTDWRRLLKGDAPTLDLVAARDGLLEQAGAALDRLITQYSGAIVPARGPMQTFVYPVQAYPHRITALNLDKEPVASGRLLGVKGQYLLLDSGVLNVRKYTGYQVTVSV